MNLIQEEAVRLIAIEIARLTNVADAAARAARIAHESAANALMFYQSARTAAAENAMRSASINEYLALDYLVDAEDAVKAGVAAREFVIAALTAEEEEKSRTV
jgi:hypothetical protein